MKRAARFGPVTGRLHAVGSETSASVQKTLGTSEGAQRLEMGVWTRFGTWRLFATHTYILSTRALWPLADGVGHFLAFAEVVEVCSIDARTVKEHVFVAVLRRDEAKTLIGDSFDRTLFHFSNPILFKKAVSAGPA